MLDVSMILEQDWMKKNIGFGDWMEEERKLMMKLCVGGADGCFI